MLQLCCHELILSRREPRVRQKCPLVGRGRSSRGVSGRGAPQPGEVVSEASLSDPERHLRRRDQRGHAREHGRRGTERLVPLWENLTLDQVFRTQFRTLGPTVLKWAVRMAAGGTSSLPGVREMVDTTPLRNFLHHALELGRGRLRCVTRNRFHRLHDAVAGTKCVHP